MLINGELVDAVSGKTYTATNPATGEEFARIPLGDKQDVDNAVRAAKEAFPAWSAMPMMQRAAILNDLADIFEEYAPKLGELECIDHGFPMKRAQVYGFSAAGYLREAVALAKELHAPAGSRRSTAVLYLQYEPIGPCALITPWNFPLMMTGSKMSPCLATGNTCVLKPPTIDATSTLLLAEAIAESDLPPGVVNVVSGPGGSVGETLAAHPDIRMVGFTGSSEVGQRIMELASNGVKRVQLELGGKNPFIVLEDADLDIAVETAIHTQYLNVGQICASPGRYYIHEKVYDKFVEMFVEASKKVIVGDPAAPGTQMGPLVSPDQRDKVEGYIASAKKEGATVVLGGERPTEPPLDKGCFVMPTVITNVTHDMRVAREEIFGPVACMIKITDADDVIAMANDSSFALCASVWTKDTARGIRMANAIEAGTIWVNGHMMPEPGIPWGGFKGSGFGKEGTAIGLKEFVQLKTVCADLSGVKTRPSNTLP